MNISLDPAELGFRRPFTQEVTQTLTIKNTHFEPVAFKVKTTAPKQYCVRPNSGRIEAGQAVTVKVLLQAMKEDPPADFKCRDKFLVQSVAITADRESQNATEIWAHVDKNDKGAIQERKIRVVFLPEEGQAENTSSRPPSFQESLASNVATVTASSRLDGRGDNFTASREVASHQSTPASSPPSSDLSSQLVEARQKIIQLQKQLSEQEARNRKNAGSSAPTDPEKRGLAAGQNAVGHAPVPDGVPVKIVAALCFISFLLALLF
ncbi:PapD-like protein [Peziza echinospora]|nr:PapD-like protein [Peziza echinospora]